MAKIQLSIFMTFQQLSTHQATLESLLVFCLCLLPFFHHQDWSENTHCFTPAGVAIEHCLYVNSHHYLYAYLPVSSHILYSFYGLFLFFGSDLEEKILKTDTLKRNQYFTCNCYVKFNPHTHNSQNLILWIFHQVKQCHIWVSVSVSVSEHFRSVFDVLATTANLKKRWKKRWVCQVWVIRRVLSLSFCKLCFCICKSQTFIAEWNGWINVLAARMERSLTDR